MSERLRSLDLDGNGWIIVWDSGITSILLFSKNHEDFNPDVELDTQKLLDFLKGVEDE